MGTLDEFSKKAYRKGGTLDRFSKVGDKAGNKIARKMSKRKGRTK